jgi:hypothetical protein
MGLWGWPWGRRGPSGFGAGSTAEEVTAGVDASHLTAIVTGNSLCSSLIFVSFSAAQRCPLSASRSRVAMRMSKARTHNSKNYLY